MNKATYFARAALALVGGAAAALPLAAQPQPAVGGAGTDAAQHDRCAVMREAMAKHPAPNAAAEARRQKRLADCEAGKSISSSENDEGTSGSQAGEGAAPPGAAGQAGQATPVSGAGAPAVAGTAAATMAPVAAQPSSTTVRGAAIAPSAALTKVAEQFTMLQFAVTTADDDLRTNSAAWVTLQRPDGSTDKCNLKSGGLASGSWENNSTKSVQCTLSLPMTFDQLRATKFVLEFDGRPNAQADVMTNDPFQTFDNWKVGELQVAALKDRAAPPQCLLDAKGSPLLVELSGDRRSYQLGEGGC